MPWKPPALKAPQRYGWPKGSDRRWRKLRAHKLADEPRCERCLTSGRLTPATEVHHRTPISEGGSKYDWDNLQSRVRRLPRRSTWRPTEDPDQSSHRFAAAWAGPPVER
jgi:5-methylcytosine-specific restriction endonuclease McrA